MAAYPRIFFACHTRHVRDEAAGRTLSAHQASILDHLDAVEPMSRNTLAAHLGVTASTMSLAIDRLTGQGYVARTRSKADGRQVELRLTPDGERVRDAKSVLDPDLVRALLKHLTPPRRAQALAGLQLLADAAEKTQMDKARLARRIRGTEPAGGSA